MKNYKLLKHTYRPAIYSLAITFCLFILMTILQRSIELFWVSSIFTYVLVVTEFFITSNFYHKQSAELEGKSRMDLNRTTQILHHFFLPSLFFWSTVGFVFSNKETYIFLLILVAFFIVYTLLLKNIIAFYDDDKETKSANYIYDLATIIILFLVTETALINFHSQDTTSVISFVFVAFLFMLLNFLTILRHHITKESLALFLFLSSIQIVLLIVLVGSFATTALLCGLVISITGYIFISVVNQMIEAHNLFDVLIEVSILILLIFALIQFSIS